jgi:phosphate:Na+ symporter
VAASGLLTLEQAIPVLLGANIGSTTTTLFASARMDLYARRAAMAHLLFNVGGVLIFIPLAGSLAEVTHDLGGSVGQQVANAHLIFNLVTAAIFLVLLRPFQRAVERAVRGEEKEILFRTRWLTKTVPEDNAQGFQLIEKELDHSLEVTRDLLETAFSAIMDGDGQVLRKVGKLERLNDFLDEEIEEAILQLSRRSLNEDEAQRTILLVRMSNLLERLGDHAEDIGNMAASVREKGRSLPEDQLRELNTVYQLLHDNLAQLGDCLMKVDDETKARIKLGTTAMNSRINATYRLHISRMREAGISSDSTLLELMTVMESANDKVRELMAMASEYSYLVGRLTSEEPLCGPT